MNNVPILGRAYYYGIGGGGEKLLERVEQEQRQKEQE